MDIQSHVDMLRQQAVAPALVERVAADEDVEELSEVCAAVESTLRVECEARGLSKHAGQAVCYLVVNKLADPEGVDRDG